MVIRFIFCKLATREVHWASSAANCLSGAHDQRCLLGPLYQLG